MNHFTQIINNQRVVTKNDVNLNCDLASILQEYNFKLTEYNEYTLGDIQVLYSERYDKLTDIFVYIKKKLVIQYEYQESDKTFVYNKNDTYRYDNHNYIINDLMSKIRNIWSNN